MKRKDNGLSSFEEGRLKESVDQLRDDVRHMYSKINSLERRMNKGTGFAIGILIIVSIIAILAILVIFHQTRKNKKIVQTGLVLVFSGAIGNLIDRVLHKEVIDFIDIFIDNQHWPAFNVADSCITIGVMFMIADMLVGDGPFKNSDNT